MLIAATPRYAQITNSYGERTNASSAHEQISFPHGLNDFLHECVIVQFWLSFNNDVIVHLQPTAVYAKIQDWLHFMSVVSNCSCIPKNESSSCSTESAVPTGTRGAPPSRSSSSPSSPSCSRREPPVQRLSSRLAESYFRSAPSSVLRIKIIPRWIGFDSQRNSLYHTKTHWNSSGNMKPILVVYIS